MKIIRLPLYIVGMLVFGILGWQMGLSAFLPAAAGELSLTSAAAIPASSNQTRILIAQIGQTGVEPASLTGLSLAIIHQNAPDLLTVIPLFDTTDTVSQHLAAALEMTPAGDLSPDYLAYLEEHFNTSWDALLVVTDQAGSAVETDFIMSLCNGLQIQQQTSASNLQFTLLANGFDSLRSTTTGQVDLEQILQAPGLRCEFPTQQQR